MKIASGDMWRRSFLNARDAMTAVSCTTLDPSLVSSGTMGYSDYQKFHVASLILYAVNDTFQERPIRW